MAVTPLNAVATLPVATDPARRVREIVARVQRLVTFPEVYFALRRVISDPDSSLDDVARLVGRDPALAAGVLRLANSAYYHFSTPVTRVEQAVALLGMLQIHDFVLGSVVVRAFPRIPSGLVDMRRFWRNSLIAATAARHLANRAGLLDSGRLFLLGLLARIGRLALWLELPDECREILHAAGGQQLRLNALETARFGFDCAAVGAALLDAWQLPTELHAPVALHTHPSAAGNVNPVVAMVHAAVCIADGVESMGTVDDVMTAIEPPVAAILDLNSDSLIRHIDVIVREATALIQVFEFP